MWCCAQKASCDRPLRSNASTTCDHSSRLRRIAHLRHAQGDHHAADGATRRWSNAYGATAARDRISSTSILVRRCHLQPSTQRRAATGTRQHQRTSDGWWPSRYAQSTARSAQRRRTYRENERAPDERNRRRMCRGRRVRLSLCASRRRVPRGRESSTLIRVLT